MLKSIADELGIEAVIIIGVTDTWLAISINVGGATENARRVLPFLTIPNMNATSWPSDLSKARRCDHPSSNT